MVAPRTEAAGTIAWYEQRLALEPNARARVIMTDAPVDECGHFGMDLEFLPRRTQKCRVALETMLFREGDNVEHGEGSEKAKDCE